MSLRSLVIKPIVFYRKHLSHRKSAPCCKYLPTCSQYAIDAVEEWGVFCGLALAGYRILRCNPFSKGGFDPVPKRKKSPRNENIKLIDPSKGKTKDTKCNNGDNTAV